jgi:hypothetical protein
MGCSYGYVKCVENGYLLFSLAIRLSIGLSDLYRASTAPRRCWPSSCAPHSP